VRQKIYVETSIPSFYFDTRKETEMVAMKRWTRKFWDEERHDYDLVTSPSTLIELNAAPSPKRELMLALMAEVEELAPHHQVFEIIGVYLTNKLMPTDAAGDASHLAYASFYGCDRLVTWNCKHLANSRKFEHIEIVNARLKLKTPKLITPLELLNDEGD
jgi:predicted nucleic acid-binding protein